MSNYYQPQQPAYAPPGGGGAQNLQFYQSSYGPATGAAPGPQQQGGYGFGAGPSAAQAGFSSAGFGGAPGGAGVAGRMGEQGGLRTGWLAAFSTEGYDGEPPLLEELGFDLRHVQAKVRTVQRHEKRPCFDTLLETPAWTLELTDFCC